MPTALITGVSGQDGSYLCELLVSRGYRVIGLTRDRAAALRRPYAAALHGVELVEARIDARSCAGLLRRWQPDEVYHLAAPSKVTTSHDDPAGVKKAILGATAIVLESVQEVAPTTRCLLAGSCEMFASSDQALDESSPREPTSPYGDAKLASYNLVRTYRSLGDLHASTAILFNHESPRRDASFVSARIVRGAVAIAQGRQAELQLGALDVRRDWGFAGDYVRAMWGMLQLDAPEDLVIGTGVAHSVADFCAVAFSEVGLDWRSHVVSDPELLRTGDSPLRLADPERARRRLGWSPEVDFRGLIAMMIQAELGKA